MFSLEDGGREEGSEPNKETSAAERRERRKNLWKLQRREERERNTSEKYRRVGKLILVVFPLLLEIHKTQIWQQQSGDGNFYRSLKHLYALMRWFFQTCRHKSVIETFFFFAFTCHWGQRSGHDMETVFTLQLLTK